MSSSIREVPTCEAILARDDEPAGPMRLPTKNASAFISEFNRRYHSAGLSVQRIESSDDQDKPVNGPSPQ